MFTHAFPHQTELETLLNDYHASYIKKKQTKHFFQHLPNFVFILARPKFPHLQCSSNIAMSQNKTNNSMLSNNSTCSWILWFCTRTSNYPYRLSCYLWLISFALCFFDAFVFPFLLFCSMVVIRRLWFLSNVSKIQFAIFSCWLNGQGSRRSSVITTI